MSYLKQTQNGQVVYQSDPKAFQSWKQTSKYGVSSIFILLIAFISVLSIISGKYFLLLVMSSFLLPMMYAVIQLIESPRYLSKITIKDESLNIEFSDDGPQNTEKNSYNFKEIDFIEFKQTRSRLGVSRYLTIQFIGAGKAGFIAHKLFIVPPSYNQRGFEKDFTETLKQRHPAIRVFRSSLFFRKEIEVL